MARRSYTRDARGRFASTPGGSARKAVKLPVPARRTVGSKPQKRRGLLIQRSAAAASKRKLKGLDPADQSLSGSLKRRAQKGAVTRARNRLAAVEQGGRRRIRTAVARGVIRPVKRKNPASSKANTLRQQVNQVKPERGTRRIVIARKTAPKLTKADKAFESVMNLKGAYDFSEGRRRKVWIDDKVMTQPRRRKLGLSGIRAESDRYYVREDVNPVTGRYGYFMGTRSGWELNQPIALQGVIRRPRRTRNP